MKTNDIRGKKHKGVTIESVYDWNNLRLADTNARHHKKNKYGVRKFDENWWKNMTEIQESIKNGTYKIKPPKLDKKVCEHKVRNLAKVNYYDLVVQHALMQVISPVLDTSYYYESAASIKGRGIHYLVKHIRKFIDLNHKKPMWWIQYDFKKCYHHVKRQKLYDKLCKKFSDGGIRHLCHEVIWALGNHNGLDESDGTEGVGIGLYPVQPFVNFYLNDLDRCISAFKDIKMYRYADNILIIGFSTKALMEVSEFVKGYAKNVLEQPLHENVGIQRLDDVHPIDFVGYLFYITHTKIRKDTKYRFKRKINYYKNNNDDEKLFQVLSAYKGWLMHCNGLNLWRRVTGMNRFSDLNIKMPQATINGKKIFEVEQVSGEFLVDREIIVKDYEDGVKTVNGEDRMCVLVEVNGVEKKFITNNPRMKETLRIIREKGAFPFLTNFRVKKLKNNINDYYFE